jgi:hypothetical protein
LLFIEFDLMSCVDNGGVVGEDCVLDDPDEHDDMDGDF